MSDFDPTEEFLRRHPAVQPGQSFAFACHPGVACFNACCSNLRLNLTYEKKKFGKREAMVPNFDGVKWGPVGALAEGDETEMERLWKAEHSIMGFYDRKNFKSYDELQAKYFQVMGLDSNGNVKGDGASLGKTAEEYVQESTPSAPAQEAPAADEKASAPSAPAKESSSSADDDLEQFEKMLRGE